MSVGNRMARARRGFTLIELMVVVAIIGLLSSVAIPTYEKMTLRSKAAERSAIMESIKRAIDDITVRNSGIPDFDRDGAPDPIWLGIPNPPGPASTTRRVFDFTLGGWGPLSLVIEGSAYYSYWWMAQDAAGNPPPRMVLGCLGDLDADGALVDLRRNYVGVGNSWAPTQPGDAAFPPVTGASDSVF